jgi:hypothetical protein
MNDYPRPVVARCPRCHVGFAAGELKILTLDRDDRLVRRCGACGLTGPSAWFRGVAVGVGR